MRSIIVGLRSAFSFSFLAAHRLTSVALAAAVEVAVVLVLAQASASSIVGVPAAVTAGIAGTVAVVVGPGYGVAVAFIGAMVFGAVEGWHPGEVAAVVAWPGIVLAVGLFARGVARQGVALRQLVATQELERQDIALKLHDETAQGLVAALLTLRRSENTEASRALIEEAIQAIRGLAAGLRPKVLDDFGLPPAVERLAATQAERSGMHVEVCARGWTDRRPPGEVELALYRVLEDALASLNARGASAARVVVEQRRNNASAAVETASAAEIGVSTSLRERIRLLGGRLESRAGALRVEIPLRDA